MTSKGWDDGRCWLGVSVGMSLSVALGKAVFVVACLCFVIGFCMLIDEFAHRSNEKKRSAHVRQDS